jgi:hypothetical protein
LKRRTRSQAKWNSRRSSATCLQSMARSNRCAPAADKISNEFRHRRLEPFARRYHGWARHCGTMPSSKRQISDAKPHLQRVDDNATCFAECDRIVTALLPSERIDSALRHSIRPKFALPRCWIPSKNRQKNSKEACQNFPHPINPGGNPINLSLGATIHNPEKVLTPQWRFRYNGALLLNSIHIIS